VLWHSSAVDTVTMPVIKCSVPGLFEYYQTWYTGYGNGGFYGTPGLYEQTQFGHAEYLKVDNSECTATNPPPNENYDPRCRPWYNSAM